MDEVPVCDFWFITDVSRRLLDQMTQEDCLNFANWVKTETGGPLDQLEYWFRMRPTKHTFVKFCIAAFVHIRTRLVIQSLYTPELNRQVKTFCSLFSDACNLKRLVPMVGIYKFYFVLHPFAGQRTKFKELKNALRLNLTEEMFPNEETRDKAKMFILETNDISENVQNVEIEPIVVSPDYISGLKFFETTDAMSALSPRQLHSKGSDTEEEEEKQTFVAIPLHSMAPKKPMTKSVLAKELKKKGLDLRAIQKSRLRPIYKKTKFSAKKRRF